MSEIILETRLPYGQTLQLAHADLTSETLDAIVNAANQWLKHGGGIAGAIVRRSGWQIQVESDARLIFTTIRSYFEHNPVSGLELVRVTIIDHPTLDVFANAWEG